MTTRIIFNGREYAGIEAMPEEVRTAYLEALTMLRDADANGIPDVLETGKADTVIGVQQSSITFNGRTLQGAELPGWARRLVESAAGTVKASSAPQPDPPRNEISGAPDAVPSMLGVLLAFVAGFVVIFATGLMFAIGGGPDHLAGRLAVAVAALVLLGWLDTQATRLARRREPLLAPDSTGYRRFVVWSSLGLFLAAVLLLGVAWFLR